MSVKGDPTFINASVTLGAGDNPVLEYCLQNVKKLTQRPSMAICWPGASLRSFATWLSATRNFGYLAKVQILTLKVDRKVR